MSWIGLLVSAPVGQAATHSPQDTQDDAPIGSLRSNAMSVLNPLPLRPITSLPWTSSQARVHRSHRMQASWSTAMTGLDRSTPRPEPRGSPLSRGHPVPVGQREQFVVTGRGLLGVGLARRLVGQQQPGQHGAAALDLRGGGLHLHPALAGPHAGRGERGRAGVDDAHPADADGIESLVVAEHGDVDPGSLGRRPDRRAVRRGDLTSVDRERHRPRALRGSDSHTGSIRLVWASGQQQGTRD